MATSWESFNLLLDFLVFGLVFLVQLDTVVENLDQFIGITIPDGFLKGLFVIDLVIRSFLNRCLAQMILPASGGIFLTVGGSCLVCSLNFF
jgi:hypothetical protein